MNSRAVHIGLYRTHWALDNQLYSNRSREMDDNIRVIRELGEQLSVFDPSR